MDPTNPGEILWNGMKLAYGGYRTVKGMMGVVNDVGYIFDGPKDKLNQGNRSLSLKRQKAYDRRRRKMMALWAKGYGEGWGKALHKFYTNTGQITWNHNECSYTYFYMETLSILNGQMNDGPLVLQPAMQIAGTPATDGKVVPRSDQSESEYVKPDLTYNATWRPYTAAKMCYTPKSKHVYEFRNNNVTSCRIHFYEYICIDDCDITIADLMTRGILEKTSGFNTDMDTNETIWPGSAMESIQKKWRCYSKASCVLNPGEGTFYTVKKINNVVFDTRDDTLDTATYIKGLTRCLQVRVQGVLGHDNTTTTLVGNLKGSIDWRSVEESHIKFADSLERPQSTFSQAKDTITTGAQVQSEEPGKETI